MYMQVISYVDVRELFSANGRHFSVKGRHFSQCCQILGGFEFDCAGKYWLGRVDKIWAGFWSVWRFSKHINCIG